MTVATTYEHIALDQNGVAVISETNTKVLELVAEMKAYGWSPEEIHFQHPYLSLGQIHSALAYYWDNAAKLDQEIEERLRKVEEIRSSAGTSDIRHKLKEKGLI